MPWREEWRDTASTTPEKLFKEAQEHARQWGKEHVDDSKNPNKPRQNPYPNVDKVKPPPPAYKRTMRIKAPKRPSEAET